MKAILASARRLYGRRPGILGVGIGTKFVNNQPSDENFSLHFYVEKKKNKTIKKFLLPKFVYMRNPSGKLNRKLKIPTDVIAINKAKPCCMSGDIIRSINERGVLTLLFKNKTSINSNRYLITCAHVAGNLKSNIPKPSWLRSNCSVVSEDFAKTLISAIPHDGTMDYDIALGIVDDNALPATDCQIKGFPEIKIKQFVPRKDIVLPFKVNCILPTSNVKKATIRSFLSSVLVTFKNGDILIQNALLVEAPVKPGDSGGLLYVNEKAVGIVFARSDNGLAWCHLLDEAFNYINKLSKLDLIPF